MSEEEIIKMLNCFPQIEVVKYILNLQKENVGLKAVLKGTTHCYDEEEHQKLRNILTEFEKQLEEDFKNEIEHPTPQIYCNCYSCKIKALDKLQELKEGKK